MILFNGTKHEEKKLEQLKRTVSQLHATQQQTITIASILFKEDVGSLLYAGIKQQVAQAVGIGYQLYTFSLTDPIEAITKTIQRLNTDTTVTGIIIQKPWRKTWYNFQTINYQLSTDYDQWWYELYNSVDPHKDVDGLHPETITAIKDNTWKEQGKVLPATCQAVLYILSTVERFNSLTDKIIIIGKSDLLGIPLYHVLKHQGVSVELLGKKDLDLRVEQGTNLLDAQVVVSATGVHKLITGEMIAENSIIIDVGEPKPDVDQESVATKASFLTPVPGGVGPLTVACLLENAIFLATQEKL